MTFLGNKSDEDLSNKENDLQMCISEVCEKNQVAPGALQIAHNSMVRWTSRSQTNKIGS